MYAARCQEQQYTIYIRAVRGYFREGHNTQEGTRRWTRVEVQREW